MKIKIIALALLAALSATTGCDSSSSSSGGQRAPARLAGNYNLNFVPDIGGVQQFLVNVEIPGGSGTAMVMITGPGFADTARVVPDTPIDVGECGAWIQFGNIAGFNLAAGDNWLMVINNGDIGQPVPGDTVDSTVGLVTSGGIYSCAPPLCDGSMLAGAVPPPARSLVGEIGGGGSWYAVNLNQNRSNITGNIPEQKVLTLYLGSVLTPAVLPPLLETGDTVSLSYRRKVNVGTDRGDFLRVVVTNGSQILDAEYLQGDSLIDGETTHAFTFVANSPEVMVEFIVGLSQQTNSLQLDDLKVSTPAGVVFSETFEAGQAGDCFVSGANANRLERRVSEWKIGNLCVSAFNAPTGVYGLSFYGGCLRRLSGTIVSGDDLSDLLDLLGGGGLFGSSGVAGIFADVWEPTWTNYFSSINVAQQSANNLIGTFSGESQNHLCLESGQLTAAKHQQQLADLDEFNWVINVTGRVTTCEPPLPGGVTFFAFGDTLGSATGDTVGVVQIGRYVLGLEPAIDDWANNSTVRGNLGGDLLTLSLADNLGRATMSGYGVVNLEELTITGALTGSRVWDNRICDLDVGSAFTLTLVPKVPPPPPPAP